MSVEFTLIQRFDLNLNWSRWLTLLQSALIAVRLTEFIEKEHEFKTPRQIFRSDLKIVLHQIRKDPNQYKSFVANRLGEIQEKIEN